MIFGVFLRVWTLLVVALRSAGEQVADHDRERAVLVRRDAGDVLADRVLDFFAAAALEIFDVLPQHGGQRGDVDRAADVLGGRDGDFEFRFLFLEVCDLDAQIVIVEAGQNGLEAVLDARVHAGEFAALCRDILCALLLGEAGGDFLGERDEVRAAQQALLDGVDDKRFERFTANRVALAAVALAAEVQDSRRHRAAARHGGRSVRRENRAREDGHADGVTSKTSIFVVSFSRDIKNA